MRSAQLFLPLVDEGVLQTMACKCLCAAECLPFCWHFYQQVAWFMALFHLLHVIMHLAESDQGDAEVQNVIAKRHVLQPSTLYKP